MYKYHEQNNLIRIRKIFCPNKDSLDVSRKLFYKFVYLLFLHVPYYHIMRTMYNVQKKVVKSSILSVKKNLYCNVACYDVVS